MTAAEHVEVLIVGAGLSGIGMAHHLREAFPRRSLAILEARESVGGTWDLFRYPGVRSDSDMHTLGYRFRPWTDAKSIADGGSILDYIRSTAVESGIQEHIRFGHRVLAADWSSDTARWTVEAVADGRTVSLTCSFLVMCSGYYSYEHGYTPAFPGVESFTGTVVHPQQWPTELDCTNKRVVVIGSGATAVTLVPALAATASHVTMLQRSPTYIMSVPSRDAVANALRKVLGERASYAVTRWKNVVMAWGIYELSRRRPDVVKAMVRKNLVESLPAGYDIDTHFTPTYQPWDQRLCAAPDGDLFATLSTGRAEVVTDAIDTFTPSGISLLSGRTLDADVVVTATGLDLLFFGGATISVDGVEMPTADEFAYKGLMLSNIPNFVYTLGYTNSSWTLKADLVSQFLCRLLRHMEKHGHDSCVPVPRDPHMARRPLFDFDAGYVRRALDRMPSSGSSAPWRQSMNYVRDVVTMRHGSIDDGVLRFGRRRTSDPGSTSEPSAQVRA